MNPPFKLTSIDYEIFRDALERMAINIKKTGPRSDDEECKYIYSTIILSAFYAESDLSRAKMWLNDYLRIQFFGKSNDADAVIYTFFFWYFNYMGKKLKLYGKYYSSPVNCNQIKLYNSSLFAALNNPNDLIHFEYYDTSSRKDRYGFAIGNEYLFIINPVGKASEKIRLKSKRLERISVKGDWIVESNKKVASIQRLPGDCKAVICNMIKIVNYIAGK